MIPDKLRFGDEIRIIAPSRSLNFISRENREIANQRLKKLGFKVTFGEKVEECDIFKSSSIKSRVDDLHQAFKDKNVKAILTAIGGFNSNQLLKYLDYKLIKKNPKIFCGYSDITALQNAFYKKTGLVTYYGPHYSSFGMKEGFDYTLEFFKKCLITPNPFEVIPSNEWSDDKWYINQENRKFNKNTGPYLINEGMAEGALIGGNLCTFNLLQGTEFMPPLENSILFIEDDDMSNDVAFDRDLQSLIQQPGFNKIKGIVIGRFQKKSYMNKKKLIQIIKTKEDLNNLPIIADVDFGHTTPIITFPIGGKVKIIAEKGKISIQIIEH